MNFGHAKIDRRSFVFGGSAILAGIGAGLSLSSCKSDDNNQNWKTDILSAVSVYQASNINPVGNDTILGRAVLNHVCEGLYNYDFKTNQTYNGVAALNPIKINNLSYDVVLRDGIKFSDGSIVSSDDVVNAFKLNMTDSKIGNLFSFIKDVQVKDAKTINFLLNYPYENFLKERLSLVYIFPKAQDLGSLINCPVGTGPWAISQFNGANGGTIDFVPNKYYQGKFSEPVKNMSWSIDSNDNTRANSIINKETLILDDFMQANNTALSSSGANIDYLQGFSCVYLMFNCLKAPFNNYQVRQAIHCAINKSRIIDKVLFGHASFAASFLQKGHSSYRAYANSYEKNTDRVRNLLSKNNINSLNCKILCENNWLKDVAEFIKEDLSDVDIDAEIIIDDNKLTSIFENKSDDYDIVLASGDPSIFGDDVDSLLSVWYGDNVWMNSRSFWKIQDIQKWTQLNNLMQKARETSGQNNQVSLWNQCLDMVYENCPILPLFHRELATVYWGDKLNNFKPNSKSGLNLIGVSANF